MNKNIIDAIKSQKIDELKKLIQTIGTIDDLADDESINYSFELVPGVFVGTLYQLLNQLQMEPDASEKLAALVKLALFFKKNIPEDYDWAMHTFANQIEYNYERQMGGGILFSLFINKHFTKYQMLLQLGYPVNNSLQLVSGKACFTPLQAMMICYRNESDLPYVEELLKYGASLEFLAQEKLRYSKSQLKILRTDQDFIQTLSTNVTYLSDKSPDDISGILDDFSCATNARDLFWKATNHRELDEILDVASKLSKSNSARNSRPASVNRPDSVLNNLTEKNLETPQTLEKKRPYQDDCSSPVGQGVRFFEPKTPERIQQPAPNPPVISPLSSEKKTGLLQTHDKSGVKSNLFGENKNDPENRSAFSPFSKK